MRGNRIDLVDYVNWRDKIPKRRGEQHLESPQENPLRFVAVISVVTIGLTLYRVISSHHITWLGTAGTVLAAAFVVLYTTRQRLAWLISLLMFAGLAPIGLLIVYLTSSAGEPMPVVVFTLALWGGSVIYILWIRERYYSYLKQ